MIDRFANYYRVWRHRGAATMDHYLWLHWAVTGRYPGHKWRVGKIAALLKRTHPMQREMKDESLE